MTTEMDPRSAITVGQKVEELEGRRAPNPREAPAETAGAEAEAEGEPGEDPFLGMIDGYAGSFWQAVEEVAIDEPDLMSWNEWLAWRKADGGLPKGVRGEVEQRREAAL